MGPKRQDETIEFELQGRRDDLPVIAQVLRAADEPPPAAGKKDDEKLSIFWRVFGGTLLSIAALVAITVYNNYSNTIAEIRTELARVNEARADLIRKDEFNNRLANNYERIQGLQQQNSVQNVALTSLKTETDGLKERLAQSTADLKVAREEVVKLRQDVDKNSSQDHERRDRRDAQFKQLDETIKEIQKGLQDCREKLARLEGQYGPPVPKKASPPKDPETAPAKKDGSDR